MEVGESLKELNMTADEISRFTKAFKDEKFREMLRDYAQEISDPANKKKYEEEITLLEQQRGNNIEFIHPEPFRALRTSVNGKQKCYINICANEKVGKPECKWGVSDDGHRGQCWSLPHSLHPGRQDTDPKGNKIMIYDVIFHPDTIHIAKRNTRFMDMLDNTAIQGIQDAFKVTLDKSNLREMSTKYKGTPQACVIRKPVPGYKARVPSEQPDPLAFPYPDEKKRPTTSPKTENSKPIQPQKAKGPTTPTYTVKYRSFIDLQDFRCSRDSAKSPRPKAIVVTVDLPLLKSVKDANLEVKEKSLLLESKKPAYRLELPLAYPVDEDKGEAKFNRQRGQLTVTLPVLPSSEVFDFTVGTAQAVSEEEEEKEEDKLKEEEEREGNKCEEEEVGNFEERGLEQQEEEKEDDKLKEEEEREGNKCEEEEVGNFEERGLEQQEEDDKLKEEEEREGNKCEEEEVGNIEERGLEQQKREEEKSEEEDNKSEVEEEKQQNREAEKSDEIHESRVVVEEEEILKEQKGDSEEAVKSNQQDELDEERELHNTLKEEEDKTRETVDGNLKVETMTTPPNYTPSEESHTAAAVVSEQAECSEAPAVDKANKSRLGGKRVVHFSEEPSQSSDNGSEEVDEDDLPTEHNIQNPEPDKKLSPPVLLREIDQDGNETVISDHSTSAGFTFQNSLLYELD